MVESGQKATECIQKWSKSVQKVFGKTLIKNKITSFFEHVETNSTRSEHAMKNYRCVKNKSKCVKIHVAEALSRAAILLAIHFHKPTLKQAVVMFVLVFKHELVPPTHLPVHLPLAVGFLVPLATASAATYTTTKEEERYDEAQTSTKQHVGPCLETRMA